MLNITKEDLIAELQHVKKVLNEVIQEHFIERQRYTCEYGVCYDMYWWKGDHAGSYERRNHIIPFLYRVLQCIEGNTVTEELTNIVEWRNAHETYFYKLHREGFNQRILLIEKAIEYINADKKLLLKGYITIIDTPVS